MGNSINVQAISIGDIADVVSAFFIIVAAVIAALSLRSHQRTAHVEKVVMLRDRFSKLSDQRVAAANFLLSMKKSDGEESVPAYLTNVLHFFEELGLFIRRKAVDEVAVWTLLSDYIRGYYCACDQAGIINRYRALDPTYYEEFEFLHRRMLRIESRRSRKSINELDFDETIVENFLETESRLNR